MRIRRVCFVGVRTDSFDAMTGFVRDVLGLPEVYLDHGWGAFSLESGERDFVEVFRPGQYDERLFAAAANGPTVAFAVDDLVGARAELLAVGVEIVADIVWAADVFSSSPDDGFGWLFFRAPDGNVYVLQQERRPVAVSPQT